MINHTNKLYTSRFNHETWAENIRYRERKNHSGCIYGCPQRLNQRLSPDTAIFVIEMNNNTNKIEGIGIIRNRVLCDKYYRVYETGNYNRYVYMGKYRLDRETIERYNQEVVNILDHILFKEKTHLKRGAGITGIPAKLLSHEKCKSVQLQKEIHQLFKEHFRQNILQEEDNIDK